MPFSQTAKEFLKYAAMRWSPRLLHWHHRILDNPPRRYMENTLLPALSATAGSSVLFVGCRSYTYHYREPFLRNRIDYWTSDIDPAARVWGERRKHIVCDVRDIDRYAPARFFDLVMLNGVFGYGVDDVASMNQTLESIHRVLKPHGHLLIGWNRGRMPDPLTLATLQTRFEKKNGFGLPDRKGFDDHSHVYDLFRALSIAA